MADNDGQSNESTLSDRDTMIMAGIFILAVAAAEQARAQGKTLEQLLMSWDDARAALPSLWHASEVTAQIETFGRRVAGKTRLCPGYIDGRGHSHLCDEIIRRDGAGAMPERCPECAHKHKNVKIGEAVKRQREKKRAAALAVA